jgi:hypothetical protein
MEYKQMLFDACSSNSEPRLLQLAGLKDPEISKSIAKNVFITEAVGLELFADYPHELLSNPSFTRLGKLNPEFMLDLFSRHYQVVPNLILPVTWFRYLLQHPSADVRRSAASNPNLQKQFHELCVYDSDTAVRMGIASNQNLAYVLLNVLRSDPDPQIKAIANQNPGNFSLTIKLPTPVNTPESLSESANGNGVKPDFAVSPITQMQVLGPPTTLTKIQSESQFGMPASSSSGRGLTMLTIAALSLLSLGLLIALWSTQSGQRGAMQPVAKPLSQQQLVDDPVIAADTTKMNRAIEIANAASLAAKKFPDKSGWKSISTQWQEAINLLNSISTTSKLYPSAQAKIRTYQVILETANQNAR